MNLKPAKADVASSLNIVIYFIYLYQEFKSELYSYCSFSHQNCRDSHHHGHISIIQICSDHCHI